MDFSLAKELKDAGFPQDRPRYATDAFSHDGASIYLWNHWDVSPDEEFFDSKGVVVVPTLADLIKECRGFKHLSHWKGGNKLGDWQAQNAGGTEISWGATPEEAIARLFIALKTN